MCMDNHNIWLHWRVHGRVVVGLLFTSDTESSWKFCCCWAVVYLGYNEFMEALLLLGCCLLGILRVHGPFVVVGLLFTWDLESV